MEPNADAEVIRRCLEGDERAYRELVHRYERQVYSIALRMLRRVEDAEDLTQETFVRMVRALDRYDPTRPFPAWLFTIVTRLCIDHLRRRKWTPVSMFQTEPGSDEEYTIEVEDSGLKPDEFTSHNEEERRTEELIQSLPPHYRIVVVRDITARKQAQQREAFIALHDPLTQLPNRHFLMEQLAQVLSLARRRHGHAAVLFVNLDHFKTVNDSLGHHAGDQLLCQVADRLRQNVRDADVVARLGSDEFVVVLTDAAGDHDAGTVADKLLQAMHSPFTVDALPLTISPSIGIALFPEHAATPDALLRCADAAMHHAKDNGRGHRQLYGPGMEASAMDVLQHERLLREAIAHNGFVLHFQPQMRLQDGALQGFEALVRWRHPERGLVGPAEFIPLTPIRPGQVSTN